MKRCVFYDRHRGYQNKLMASGIVDWRVLAVLDNASFSVYADDCRLSGIDPILETP